MELGTRYPTLGFYTGGAGQADDGIPPQPFETFCYDSALLQAKIQDFNVVPYTSVLPDLPVPLEATAWFHMTVMTRTASRSLQHGWHCW